MNWFRVRAECLEFDSRHEQWRFSSLSVTLVTGKIKRLQEFCLLFLSFLCSCFNDAHSNWVCNAEFEITVNCNFRRVWKRVVMAQLNRQYWHLSAELRKSTQNPHRAVEDKPGANRADPTVLLFQPACSMLSFITTPTLRPYKWKDNFTITMKAQRGSRGTALLFL